MELSGASNSDDIGPGLPTMAVARSQPEPLQRMLARILVSDDNPEIQQIYTILLPRHGFEVITAPGGDGRATVALCQQQLPDLVITDVNKPGMNGYQVCQAIRSDPRTAHIPVLFVTAMDEWLERRQGRSVGADDYIIKPFLFEGLLYRLVMLLALARDAQERLVTLTMALPDFEHHHPVTGLPGPQALSRLLPQLTAGDDWAALTFEINGFDLLLRSFGRTVADDLLLRMVIMLRAALAAPASNAVAMAHPGYDWRITLIGPAAQLESVEAVVFTRFLPELQQQLATLDVARGWITYTDTEGQFRQAPRPHIVVKRLDASIGPLNDLRALWNALDRAPSHSLASAMPDV